jgi:hypothetical protein
VVRTNARLARPHGANLFGAIITAVLLITGAWLVDELGEASGLNLLKRSVEVF